MATTDRQPAPETPRGSRRFASANARTMQLYYACLAVTGRRKTLENFIPPSGNRSNDPWLRYYLALALALEHKPTEAISQLRTVIAENPSHAEARKLAYRLLLHQAALSAQSQDWPGLSTLIAEALALSPDGTEAARDLSRFKHALPLAHLRAGRRDEAATLWEQQFKQNPDEAHLLHNLALIHYWDACGRGNGDPTSASPQWLAAIAFWTVLIHLDKFWKAWKEEREREWGFGITPDDLKAFRDGFLEQQFDHFFQVRVDESRQTKHTVAADAYEDCRTAAMLERKSAECWKKVMEFLPAGKRPAGLLSLPGGVQFFRRFGLLPHVADAAEILGNDQAAAEYAARLRIYFSEFSLGTILVLVDERNKPEEALHLIDRLPQKVRASVEAGYLRSLALARKGTALSSQGQFFQALESWKAAREQALSAHNACKKLETGFGALLSSVQHSVCKQVVEAAQKEASRLKREEKLDQAITVLERARELDKDESLIEYLCIYLCDRGGTKIGKDTKDYTGARADFNRVLKFKPDYRRAKDGLATILNNEGCEEKDPDRAIRLFEQALELEPDSHPVQRNLAIELRGKAVKVFKALNEYTVRSGISESINLLERATKLPCFNLKPDALEAIRAMAELPDKMAEGFLAKVEDDVLKGIFSDLVSCYKIRRRLRGY